MPRPELMRDRSLRWRAVRFLLSALAILILLSPSSLSAQFEGRTYAITGARIVPVAGDIIENGTIVLRGGLIEALGAEVMAPADAVLIDGDSLTVYPGFIDAFSQAGLVLPRGDDREYAGNIADRMATRYFDPDSSDLPAYREQGLTAALIARSDGVFGGQAVLMNLMGDDIPAMTVKAPVVQTMGYQGQQGYPGTLMAVVAYQRQTLIDAAYHDMLLGRYQGAPRGMARPPAQPELEALIPVAKGETPVMGIVRTENDFKRLRGLAREYGLQYWIAGAVEAFRVQDLIREAGVPVLVSLDFPAVNQVTGHPFDRAFKNLTEEEKTALDERDRAAIQGNPAAVYRAGVPFALATGGMSSPNNFLKNVRLAVEAGLPAEEALRALTIHPATIFGVAEVLGTLEPGKIANLTVSHGDIFTDDEAYVAHVFVDGRKESFEEPKAPAAGGSGAAAGSWTVTVSLGGESAQGTLDLTQEGDDVTGVLSIQGMTMDFAGTISAGTLELTGSIPEMGSVTLTATIQGNAMDGSIGLGPMGTAAFSGTRSPGGNATERRVGR
jgi:imidazolonepropionase-like amidohydrolase